MRHHFDARLKPSPRSTNKKDIYGYITAGHNRSYDHRGFGFSLFVRAFETALAALLQLRGLLSLNNIY